MSHVNTVTITLAEYEELKSLKEKYGNIKRLTIHDNSAGSFWVKANHQNARHNLIVKSDLSTDGGYSVSFNIKSMCVGEKFLIEKTQ